MVIPTKEQFAKYQASMEALHRDWRYLSAEYAELVLAASRYLETGKESDRNYLAGMVNRQVSKWNKQA